MFSYIARIFSALWTVVCALLTLATHNNSAIVQLVALPRCTKGADGPAIANLRDITSGSSLSSLGRLSTIEELEEEEDFDDKEREASGAEAVVDTVRTTRVGTLRPPRLKIRHGRNDKSHPSQSWPQYYAAEGGYNTGTSSGVGHHDYVKTLLGQDGDGESVQDNFDVLSKLQELTAALSRFSLFAEETQIAWIRSYDGTIVPVGLRQDFNDTKECGYYDTGGGSVTLVDSPSLQLAQCRQLAHEGFDSDANSRPPSQYDAAEFCHNSIISSSVGYDDLQMLLAQGEQEEASTRENIDVFIGPQELTPASSCYSEAGPQGFGRERGRTDGLARQERRHRSGLH